MSFVKLLISEDSAFTNEQCSTNHSSYVVTAVLCTSHQAPENEGKMSGHSSFVRKCRDI